MLNSDRFFVAAITRDADLMATIGGRIYDPVRPDAEDDEDVLPYVIVTYDSGTSAQGDKDTPLARIDTSSVSVIVAADGREELAELTDAISDAINDAFLNLDALHDEHPEWKFLISDATESAGPVTYDDEKPCHFQILTYQVS